MEQILDEIKLIERQIGLVNTEAFNTGTQFHIDEETMCYLINGSTINPRKKARLSAHYGINDIRLIRDILKINPNDVPIFAR